MKKPVPCFVCGREFESAVPEDVRGEYSNQPYKGTTFQSHGQYGSTVFDPPPTHHVRDQLEINICDLCLLIRKRRVLHRVDIDRGWRIDTVEPWDPKKHG